jgi:hypothetical protein
MRPSVYLAPKVVRLGQKWLRSCGLTAYHAARATRKARKSWDPAGLGAAGVNRWRPSTGRPDSGPCPGRGGPEEPGLGSGPGERETADVGQHGPVLRLGHPLGHSLGHEQTVAERIPA